MPGKVLWLAVGLVVMQSSAYPAETIPLPKAVADDASSSLVKTKDGYRQKLLPPQKARVKNMGKLGMTYGIAEPNAYEEVMARVKAWYDAEKAKGGFDKEMWRRKIRRFRPKDAVDLPRAVKDDSRLVDMTWESPYDIPDGKGNILYPKGFRFNPAALLHNPAVYVVLDVDDKVQLDWFKKSEWAKNLRVKVLAASGFWREAEEYLGVHVFYANKMFVDRFQVHVTPSVIYQEGVMMRVEEIEPAGALAKLEAQAKKQEKKRK